MKKKNTGTENIYTAIYDVVSCIPEGRVTSYGAVAKAVGLKSGARMVARAMSHSTGIQPILPVHRVVNGAGILSGEHSTRQKMLEKENIQLKGNRIVNYKNLFWDPMIEINY